MPAKTVRHQHRHFKTLIVLVLSMTGGTYFLFWVGGLAPVTPLRGSTGLAVDAPSAWDRIQVQARPTGDREPFFHFRIDPTGRLLESRAWQAGQGSGRATGTIHILVSCSTTEARLTASQSSALVRLIADLRGRYGIAKDRVVIEPRG